MAVLSTILSLTGVGGLAITAASIALKLAIKLIGGALIRKGTTKEILNSPHVLGSLQYDKNIIKDKHFNRLFAQVTGLNSKDNLATALKVVDGIDLHRSMRQSLLVPNPDTYIAMTKLGYPDPLAYPKITLSDLLAKTGVKDDWRQTLRNTIEIKGLDYNTNWTRFVKGIAGNRNHYAKEKRLTRNEMAEQRRRSLLAKKWRTDSTNLSLNCNLFGVDEETGKLTFGR